MKQSWTIGVGKELTKDIERNFKESLVTRHRLKDLLQARISQSLKEGRGKKLYDSPNWAYLQADKRGYERAMQEIIDLIE